MTRAHEAASSPTQGPGTALLARPPATQQMWSIRWLVTTGMIGLVGLIVLSVAAVMERDTRRALTTEIETGLELQARNLALVSAGALLTETPEWTLIPVIRQTLEREPQLAYVTVVDRAGMIRGDGEVRRLNTRFAPTPGLTPIANAPASAGGVHLLGDARLLVASAPIAENDGRVLGTAWVGLHRRVIDQRLAAARRELMIVLGVFLALGIVAAWALSSVLLRPIGALRAGLERIGRGELDTHIERRDRTELGALADTVNRMAAELLTAQAEMVERGRLAHEMELASRIQRSLLPRRFTLPAPFTVAASQLPATEVGGDYYQGFVLADGRIGLAIADVSGKGLAGSLVTAMLHALLQALAPGHDSPAALLATLDRQLGGMLERGSFVTMFYGVLDPVRGTVTFASAGHNPVLVVRAAGGRAEWCRARGAPLAALRGHGLVARYEEVTVTLAPGDLLVQYTDGITEALDPTQAEFGAARMAEIACGAAREGAESAMRAIASAVERWRAGRGQDDDETLLLLARAPEHAAAVDTAGAARPAPAAGAEAPVPAMPALAMRAEAPVPAMPALTMRAEAPVPAVPALAMRAETHAPAAFALARFAEAAARGQRLTLPASLMALPRLDDWLATLDDGRVERDDGSPAPATADADPPLRLMTLALYEACSNVIEHACGQDPRQSFDVWWVAEAATGAGPGAASPAGYFLLRDHGRPFHFEAWQPSQLTDPQVRRRGRGFGLDIMHRAATRVLYWPGTAEGNLMLVEFDSHCDAIREEAS